MTGFLKKTASGEVKPWIYISADLEGTACTVRWAETEIREYGYDMACRQMALETAAACRAVMAAGYEAVVKDAHDYAVNIDPNLLPKGVRIIRGWMSSPYSMVGGLEPGCAGVIYIGYHSPAGSNASPLAHTMNYKAFNWIKINGEIVSEFDINALLADEMGVPSLFLAGDQGMCGMAEENYPGIITYATKQGTGNAVWSVHPQEAVEEIESGVARAMANMAKVRPLSGSYTLEISFRKHQDARTASWYPGAELVDEHTVRFTAGTPLEMATARMFMTNG